MLGETYEGSAVVLGVEMCWWSASVWLREPVNSLNGRMEGISVLVVHLKLGFLWLNFGAEAEWVF